MDPLDRTIQLFDKFTARTGIPEKVTFRLMFAASVLAECGAIYAVANAAAPYSETRQHRREMQCIKSHPNHPQPDNKI